MFQTLRSRLVLSYAVLIVVIVALVAAVLLVILVVSQRSRLVPQFQQLTGDYQAITRVLRDLPADQRDLRSVEAQAAITAAASDSGARLLFLTPNHEVLFDTRGRLAGETLTLNELPDQLFSGLESGPGGGQLRFVRFRDSNGQQWIGQERSLSGRFGSRNIRLLNAIPEATPLSTFRENFLRPLALAGGVALVIALLMAWLISRSVARPLQKMSAAAEAIARGHYDQHIDPAGPREVRSLAHSFNAMAAQVEASRQAQKDFVANVSHDLKTPLTSIQGWSQAILDGAAADPDRLERAAAVIHNESARMSRMVNQLLLLANLESGRVEMQMRPLALQEIIDQVRRALLFQAQEKEVALETNAPETPVQISGDRDSLVQLFVNLGQNSLASVDQGGRITLQVAANEAGRPLVAVVDNGRGIPRAELARIFERFYQVDQARTGRQRGTGLGLSIVQSIAAAHGATVTVDSVEGLGSRFEVVFP